MTTAKFQFKLSTKGKILVVIPLAMQFIAATVLSYLFLSVEREREAVEHSRKITSEALLIAKLVYDAEIEMYTYVEFQRHPTADEDKVQDAFGKEYDKRVTLIVQELRDIKQLVKSSKSEREKELVQDYIHCVRMLLDASGQMRRSLDRGRLETAFALGNVMAYSQGYLRTMSELISDLIKLEEKDSDLKDEVKSKRDQIGILIWVFLILDLAIVIGLLAYFNKDTIARLTVLMDNIARMSKQQALNPVLVGKDEFAELDNVFHNMADAMEAAKQRERELMEMKKQIMAMVSHDLRSPLTSLQFTLELLQKNNYGELNAQGAERVDASNKSVQRLIRMINDLLDLEKLEAGKLDIELKELPVDVLIIRSLEAVEGMANAKQIRFAFEETELEIKGDGDRLIQVLVNLLSNAVKFSPENSVVSIEAITKDNYVVFRVSDHGPGVPENFRQQIFDRYRQLEGKMKSSGSGLGLAISRLIIEMHDGKIGVDESKEGGSSFWFTVPLVHMQGDFEDPTI